MGMGSILGRYIEGKSNFLPVLRVVGNSGPLSLLLAAASLVYLVLNMHKLL
jgi:hypothetical protein